MFKLKCSLGWEDYCVLRKRYIHFPSDMWAEMALRRWVEGFGFHLPEFLLVDCYWTAAVLTGCAGPVRPGCFHLSTSCVLEAWN